MSLSYLDTGVTIAYLDTSDRQMHGPARALLLDERRTFVVSPFTELELVPHLVRERRPELPLIQELLANFRSSSDLTSALRYANTILQAVNIGTLDALHVGAAIAAGCTEFITTERPHSRKSLHKAGSFIRIVYLPDALA